MSDAFDLDEDDADFNPASARDDVIYMGQRKYVAEDQTAARIATITASAFAAGWLMYARYDVPGLPLMTGLIYAGIIGPAAMLTFAFLPALVPLTEAVAVSRLCVACVAYVVPDAGAALVSAPFVLASVVIGGGACLYVAQIRAPACRSYTPR